MSNVINAINIRFLWEGLQLTLFIAASTIVLSILFGSLLALMRNYGNKLVSRIAAVYIEAFRNTPMLLWILSIRFLVPIPPVASGVLSLSLFTSAVMAEIVRGGLNGVGKGQFEAALSQGFTLTQTLLLIVMPQCFRNIIPALLSQIITVIKDTSFLWVVAIEEFTGKGMILMGALRTTAEFFMLFGTLALVYFVICFTLSLVVRTMQKRKAA